MYFLDRMQSGGDLPLKSEFKKLFTEDDEFKISFIAVNNPSAIIAKMRNLKLITPDQVIYPDEVYNFLAALYNAGSFDALRAVTAVPLEIDAPYMTEEILDGIAELEIETAPSTAV